MIFELQTWHALAKLRIHTDKTLKVFEDATVTLGKTVRHFHQTTCKEYITRELKGEMAVRGRRNIARVSVIKAKGKTAVGVKTKGKEARARGRDAEVEGGKGPDQDDEPSSIEPIKERKQKTLNLNTTKWHGLLAYPSTIRKFGTSDNYTTQIVSPTHI